MDELVRTVWSKIKPEWKCAFLSAFVLGLLTHAFAMTNNLLTSDSMWNLISDQDMISSGRQFLTYVCGISSEYSLPWINGLLAMFFLALAAVLLTESLRIKSGVAAFLTGFMTVVFPVVAATFSFSYTIDGYALAIVLAVLAFLVCNRTKYGFIPAAIVLCISIGAYQSYYSITMLLCIFSLVQMILKGCSFKKIWKKAWRYLFMGVASYILYVVSLKIMLKIKGAQLSGYQGTDMVLSFQFSDLGRGILTAYKNFVRYFRVEGFFYRFGMMGGFFYLFLLAAAFGYLVLFIKGECYKKIWKIVLSLFLFCIIPMAACLPCIMNPDMYFHIIMRYPMVMVLLFGIAILSEWDRMERKNMHAGRIRYVRILGMSALLVLCFEYMVISNIIYFNLNERYEKSYAICVEMVGRIHQTDGYSPYMPVAVFGGDPNREYYPWSDSTGDTIGYMVGVGGDFVTNSSRSYAEFCRHYLGVSLVTLGLEEEENIVNTEEFAKMGCFPEQDGIRIINGVLVVKMGG